MQDMINFKKKLYEQLTYEKLGRFIALFGNYTSKTIDAVDFEKKPNLGLKWPKLCHIRTFLEYRL